MEAPEKGRKKNIHPLRASDRLKKKPENYQIAGMVYCHQTLSSCPKVHHQLQPEQLTMGNYYKKKSESSYLKVKTSIKKGAKGTDQGIIP